MSSSPLVCGYYGKIPHLGDFVRHNLPRSFLEHWDDWLQQVVNTTQTSLGETWLDIYLTSPVYRFVLSPGICGENGWLGVIIPSVDKVGRYFPFTICAPTKHQTNPFESMTDYHPWFVRAEEIALAVLDDNFDSSVLAKSIAELNSIYDSTVTSSADDFMIDSDTAGYLAIRHPMQNPLDTNRCYAQLLNSLMLETSFAYSLWWTSGSQLVQPSLLVSQGLPPIEKTAAFFDGKWHKWGWFNNDPSRLLVKLSGDVIAETELDPWDESQEI